MRLEDRKGDKSVCADCDFSRRFDATGVQCIRPECSHFDVVEGRQPVKAKEARTSGACGNDARFFVARKPPSPWPPRIFFTIIAIAAASYLTKGWLW